jgi:hypothetical protein
MSDTNMFFPKADKKFDLHEEIVDEQPTKPTPTITVAEAAAEIRQRTAAEQQQKQQQEADELRRRQEEITRPETTMATLAAALDRTVDAMTASIDFETQWLNENLQVKGPGQYSMNGAKTDIITGLRTPLTPVDPLEQMISLHEKTKIRRTKALATYDIDPSETCTAITVRVMARLPSLRDRKVFLAMVASSASKEEFLDQVIVALDGLTR